MKIELDEKFKVYIVKKVNFDLKQIEELSSSIKEEEAAKLEEVKAIYKEKRAFIKKDKDELDSFIAANKLCKCEKCKEYHFKADFKVRDEKKEEWDCIYQGIINSGENEYRKANVSYSYQTCPGCGVEYEISRHVENHFGETVSRDRMR